MPEGAPQGNCMYNKTPYETLDPDDWGKMRALAHRMVDDAITYLECLVPDQLLVAHGNRLPLHLIFPTWPRYISV
jgi:hypothetical protein